MFKTIRTRLQQGHRTLRYPEGPAPTLSDRFLGRPELPTSPCAADCTACVTACPTGAVTRVDGSLHLDLGACLFCGACMRACATGALRFSRDPQLATRERGALQLSSGGSTCAADAHDPVIQRLLGRSLKLRQVSAGGCNACEADANVLTTLAWDLGRFGIDFVASPRHADGLLVTGPVTENMREALIKTYEAVPSPKIVIAAGTCAISGGIFAGHPEVHNGVEGLLPVDLYVPGCPYHPLTLLDGLLRLIGRIKED